MSESKISLEDSSALSKVKYDRSKLQVGHVHIGVGNFHRAHQALYTDEAIERGKNKWGICGIAMLPSDQHLVESLKKQAGLYTLVERDSDSQTARVIGSMVDIIQADESKESALDLLSSESIKIVSLTITENGYCHNPATKQIELTRPDIIHDLANPLSPKTACGLIVEALSRRMKSGLNAFTVISCDNIVYNGDTCRNVVLALARARSSDLASWIETHVAFPNTMVDRITPATRPETAQWVEEQFGIVDQAPVVAESFRQWVIEDKFVTDRPSWEKSGATFVADVHPYEVAKIRLLNVSHNAFSYPGLVAGMTYVHEAATDPILRRHVERQMNEEVAPTLAPIPGYDYPSYQNQILDRFCNTAVADRLDRVCMDGSQKFPNQLFPVIKERIAAGKPFRRLAFEVAAWLRYLSGTDENGIEYKVADPLADRLQGIAVSSGSFIAPYFEQHDIFPTELTKNTTFSSDVEELLKSIYTNGMLNAIKLLG